VLSKRGIHPEISANLGGLLKQAGLQQIQQYRLDIPIGQWGGRVGIMAAKDMLAYNQNIKPVIVKESGIDQRQYDFLTQEMQKEWEEHNSFFSIYITCGQLPAE
jgi:hypothetical protein